MMEHYPDPEVLVKLREGLRQCLDKLDRTGGRGSVMLRAIAHTIGEINEMIDGVAFLDDTEAVSYVGAVAAFIAFIKGLP